MRGYFDWETLSSVTGASIAVSILTQFFKNIFSKIPTQILSYIIAVILLLVSTIALDGVGDWRKLAIAPINAVIVSLTSNGGFTALKRITNDEDKK